MLHLLFFLLKIIGFVLLALICLILLLLLALLAVPVRYRGRGSYYGKPEGVLRITWFFHVFSLKISYVEQLAVTVRVLGIRLFREKGKKAEEDFVEEPIREAGGLADDTIDSAIRAELQSEIHSLDAPEPEKPDDDSADRDIQEESEDSTPAGDAGEGNADDSGGMSGIGGVTENPGTKDDDAGRQRLREDFSKKAGVFSRLLHKLKKSVRRTGRQFRKMGERWKGLWEKKEALSAFIHDEQNRKTFLLVKRLAIKAVRHVLPRKLRGDLTFGLEDPYLMGQILSGAALFYPLYHDSLFLTPVFDRKIAEGKLFFRGRVRFGTFLVIGLRLLFHKNFRVLLKKILNQGGI